MTLTKEWLLKTIAELEEERDAIPGAVTEDAAMALAAMKMALASLTAEPVSWMVRDIDTGEKVIRLDRSYFGGSCQPLYTAPPAPVVPDEAEMPSGPSVPEYNFGWANGWNSCREEVLQGAVGKSPAIPDGWVACSEQMPEDAQWCAVNTEYGYYVQCWSDGQGWLGDDISIPKCDVTHWMPLPAAPQQDAKTI